MNRILGAGVLKSIKSLVDGGIDYTISTSPPKDNPLVLLQKPVVFLIQEGIKEPESFEGISKAMEESGIQSPIKGKKSPSNRLRSVLYVLWEQGQQDTEFNLFYEANMQTIIDHYKSKLI